jgi:formylglycine-generating enzyme required for sulfatase activity
VIYGIIRAATPLFPVHRPDLEIASFGVCLALCMPPALLAGCEQAGAAHAAPDTPGQSAQAAAAVAGPPKAAAQAPPAAPAKCPEGALEIAGAEFLVGTGSVAAAPEESPRFATRVADFCLDETEVTVRAYAACVEAGACTPGGRVSRFCNAQRTAREEHPMNCVDWNQASAYCSWKEMRLPSEVEWEYAARGGTEYLSYSFGNHAPDGKTCWKHVGGTCKVRSFPAGAFGLHDMTGNVWEWTSSGFGPYPWPPAQPVARVYRGGSWSRRFEKWLSPRLRNRFRASERGSHLGFRCAATPPGTRCPYGNAADGSCLHGVERVECVNGETWNGARCARKSAPRCPRGQLEKPGLGCVSAVEASTPGPSAETSPVTRARAPQFDADCQKFHPERPHAYRLTGGTHAGRNGAGRASGCINRDVGVGWNSACCP